MAAYKRAGHRQVVVVYLFEASHGCRWERHTSRPSQAAVGCSDLDMLLEPDFSRCNTLQTDLSL